MNMSLVAGRITVPACMSTWDSISGLYSTARVPSFLASASRLVKASVSDRVVKSVRSLK